MCAREAAAAVRKVRSGTDHNVIRHPEARSNRLCRLRSLSGRKSDKSDLRCAEWPSKDDGR